MVDVDQVEDIAQKLVHDGTLFMCGPDKDGEMVYVHKDYATQADRDYTQRILSNPN